MPRDETTCIVEDIAFLQSKDFRKAMVRSWSESGAWVFCRNATKLSTTEESLRDGLLLDRMRPRKSESRGERADFWGALYALSCSMAMVVIDANVYRVRVR